MQKLEVMNMVDMPDLVALSQFEKTFDGTCRIQKLFKL